MDFFKKHIEAIIGVVIFVATIIFLLLYLGLYKPVPIPPEEGIVMDFGGSGNGTPDPGPARITPTKPKPQNNSSQSPSVSNMTQDFEESVSVPSNPNNVDTEEQTENNTAEEAEEETVVQEEENQSTQSVSNFNWGQTSNSNAAGNGSGNPGSGGDGSSAGSGGGSGEGSGNVSGNGWSLGGRSAESLPTPIVTNCDGYVIVIIEVDQTGKVVNAYAKPGGCTACESNCINKAVASAKSARFNSDPSAKVRQTGSITYNFRPE